MVIRASLVLTSSMLAGMAFSAPALAQADGATPGSRGPGLEEIVVLAQKRAESLQDVPIAITALTPTQLTNLNPMSTADLQQLVPGLRVNVRASSVMLFLRGVGVATNTPGLDPNVATYIDGVYSPSVVGANFQFNSIERIEVLRGPQGTLFGRNATGGVMNVYTRDPGAQTAVDAKIGYGNFNTISGQLYANAPLGEGVAANVAMVYNNQQDGWGFNSFTGKDIRKGKNFALRGKIRAELSDRTEVKITGWYSSQSNDYGASSIIPGVIGRDNFVKQDGYYDHTSNRNPGTKNKQYGGSLKVDHDLGGARITNIFAYQEVKPSFRADADTRPADISFNAAEWTDRTLTNELQLLSDNSSSFKWVAGLFLMKQWIDHDYTIGGSSTPGGRFIPSKLTTTSIAPFAQGTLTINDRLSITGGIRYTRDKRSLSAAIYTAAGAVVNAPFEKETSFSKVTWRGSVDYKFSDNAMIYASANRGFKSGTFNLAGPTDAAVHPETLTAYEAGLKLEALDRRLQFNTAVFWYEYKDLILRGTIPGTNSSNLFNAAQARVKGVDVDFQAILTDGLRLSGGFEYLSPKYRDFLGIKSTRVPGVGTTSVAGQDLSGNMMIFATKFSGNLGLTYNTPVSFGELTLDGSVSYKSKSYFDPDNRVAQPGFALVNASARIDIGDTWNITAFGSNLTGKKYFQDMINAATGDAYTPGAPRTYGIQVGFKFGGS